jgi:hypothetical protein
MRIKGVSIGIVKQDKGAKFTQWQTDYVGLGVRDGKGNPVDDRVSMRRM